MGSQPRGISASRGAAVLGLSEYMTPLEVWQRIMEEREPGWNEKNGYALPPESESAAMRWGTAFEGAIIGLAERESGKKILDRETEFFYSEKGCKPNFTFLMAPEEDCYITCHIDGAYDDSDGVPYSPYILHEGKTTSAIAYREKWGEAGTDHIPQSYQVQVQHQMLCTGAQEAVVSVLVWPETPDKWEAMGWKITVNDRWICVQNSELKKKIIAGDDWEEPLPERWADVLYEMGYFHQYPVRANPKAQKVMVEKYRDFWHNHVLAGKPPEPRNYDDVKRLFTEPVGTIVCDAAMTAWWREYDAIRKEIGKSGKAAKRQEKLRLRILSRTLGIFRPELGIGLLAQAEKIKIKEAMTVVMDDESMDKVIYRDSEGGKLGQWSAKSGFR